MRQKRVNASATLRYCQAPLGSQSRSAQRKTPLPDAATTLYRAQIIAATGRAQLPAIYAFRNLTEEGGLMSYGVDVAELFRRVANYVDRILKGTKPADLPVEQSAKVEFLINLQTAKTLAVEVPLSLLIRADDLLE